MSPAAEPAHPLAIVRAVLGYATTPDAPVTLPASLLRGALDEAEAGPAVAPDAPPHPDGWRVRNLAARYCVSPSTMRERVAGGEEFGAVGSPGGPRHEGRGYIVPHAAVLTRDARVNVPAVAPPAPPPAAPTPASSGKPMVSLSEARRARTKAAQQ